ncbi:hypothetical protein [Aeromonas caviae]|uniref:hypothetical protein n=1 Tax=Aeromonas caviae TaxID=648 RepID=UPI0029DA0314|nr:hypothetical protein [Aeromonas caviae]MDX7852967.1 hypothetical protein [Aeromonas caviae]
MQTPSNENFCQVILKPFKANWAESIHFFVIALGIIVSGAWAFHTFDILSQKEVAEANLQKTNSDLDKAKLELQELRDKIDGTISSDIMIDVEQHALSDNKVGLIINVTVKNNGTQDIDMTWNATPIKVYKLNHKNDLVSSQGVLQPPLYRSLKTKNIKDEKNVSINNLYLFVGAKKNLSFFTEVEAGNLYYIAFEAEVDAAIKNSLKKHGKTGVWLSSRYIFVK